MINRTFWILGALLLVTGPQAEAQNAPQAPPRAPPQTAMECGKGNFRASQDLKDLSKEGNAKCKDSIVRRGLAIDVGPATNAYADNPSCPQGDTDRIARDVARTASTDHFPGDWLSTFTKFWSNLYVRTKSLGPDVAGLVQGDLLGKGETRCQIFVVPLDVPGRAITRIEFQVAQGGNVWTCFQTTVRESAGGMEQYAFKTGGSCEIGWSGWQSGLIVDDKAGAIVAAVFKNWSQNLMRTGVLWVWYK